MTTSTSGVYPPLTTMLVSCTPLLAASRVAFFSDKKKYQTTRMESPTAPKRTLICAIAIIVVPLSYSSDTDGLKPRRRRALLTTVTLLSAMAALAMIGLSKIPKKGYKTPAAMGTPKVL